jgi:hypothetical protein
MYLNNQCQYLIEYLKNQSGPYGYSKVAFIGLGMSKDKIVIHLA